MGIFRIRMPEKEILNLKPETDIAKIKRQENTKGHSYGRRYGAKKASCSGSPVKSSCISVNQDRRDLNIYDGVKVPETEKMRGKIDSKEGRKIYSKRMSIIEPIFGNIRFNKGLDYFSLRTKAKVNIQWLLWCMVHNIEKIVTKGQFRQLLAQ